MKESHRSKINKIFSAPQPLTITTSLIQIPDIASGKMYLSQTQQTNIFIISYVLPHTEEPSNSYNFFAKIITLKENISSDSRQENKNKSTL